MTEATRHDPRIRCAIYTRKSSEEGLEQAFNSLHAQREACEAYVMSQRHEGWCVIATPYDDGGFSGGTLDRPALQSLLADIDAGKVDVVIVYKIDRLTRSLFDFAKIVETFDAHEVSSCIKCRRECQSKSRSESISGLNARRAVENPLFTDAPRTIVRTCL